jgi:hypothetical protein
MPDLVYNLYNRLEKKGYTSDARSLARYFNDSAIWLSEMATVLKATEGVGYVVVGSNMTRGMRVDTPRALLEIGERSGFKGSVMHRYRIVNYHMQYPTKDNLRIESETILRFVPN